MSLLDELLDSLNKLPPEEVAKLEREVAQATSKQIWFPQPGPQSDAYFSLADETFYGGQAGGGKGLLPEQEIVTPFGFKVIKELKVGDSVIGRNGKPTRVIGVYPQPQQWVYEVTFSDGAKITTDGPHKWNYSIARQVAHSPHTPWKVATTEQLAAKVKAGKHVLIPLCEPVAFTKTYRHEMCVIEPYSLGLLLGDGYTAQTGAGSKWAFATNDAELVQALSGDWVREGETCNYRLRGIWRDRYKGQFDRLGLSGCKADTKFVPDAYKMAGVATRQAILQGLMDTDGTVTPDGKAYFTSTSKQLAEDVRFLVLSLGGKATITDRIPICSNGANGPTEGHRAWTLYIRMPNNKDLFRLERKKALAGLSNGGRGTLKRRIVSIEKLPIKQHTICIAVDSAESLYIAGREFIVTHNTDLILGLAVTSHTDSLLLRRQSKEANKLFDRLEQVIGNTEGRNRGNLSQWKFDGRTIDINGCKYEKDKEKFKGQPHDLIAFDEIGDFTQSQYQFIKTWNRSARPGQRCRVICAGNPPTTAEGLWVIEYWGPWLNPKHPNPAKDGELRWFITDKNDKTHEVHGPGMHIISHEDGEKEEVLATSRTFIRARLADNAYLVNTDYAKTLDALPAELRAAYRDGRFQDSIKDDLWQIIPTKWILEAQDRWTSRPPEGIPMTAIGVDVAQGGEDNTVLAARHDWWFDTPQIVPGKKTPMGSDVAGLIIAKRRDRALPIVDNGGGYGGAVIQVLKDNNIDYVAYMGSKEATARSKCGQFRFKNTRTQAYWQFREALDPDQPGGSPIALPPIPRILSDLAAPKFKVENNVLIATPKETVIKDLGRSPDEGDSIVMSWIAGDKMLHTLAGYGQGRKRVNDVKVNVGYANRRRSR